LRRAWRRVAKATRAVWDGWPDVIDRAIYTVAPAIGSRRMAIRQHWRIAKKREAVLNAAWSSAESDRTNANKWMGSRLSPDSALESDLDSQRQRCEESYRNNTIAHGAVEGRVANEVGTGILPQGRISAEATSKSDDDAKEINRRLEDVARRWSENGVDRTGLHSLVQTEKLVCRTFAIYGEAFVQLGDRGGADRPIPLVLDVIHPLRVETPPEQAGNENVRLGIKYDRDGKVVGYYVRRTHPHDTVKQDLRYDYVPKFDDNGQPRMLHVFDPLFPGQTRGIPWMGACLNRLKDADDVIEFTIISMQIEACFTAFVKPGDAALSPHDRANAISSDTDADGNRLEEIRPGAIEYLNKGEEVEFGNPQRPGGTFLPMIEFTLRSIAAALNYPYELLANNFFRTTFSSGRLSMMVGRLGFNMRRQCLIEKLLTPIWKRIVFETVMVGELNGLVDAGEYARQPHQFEQHIWQTRSGVIHINPEQERKAQTLALEHDMETLADIYAEGGRDWEEQLGQRYQERYTQIKQDVELAAKRLELEKSFGLQPGQSMLEDDPYLAQGKNAAKTADTETAAAA